MDSQILRELLEAVRAGRVDIETAAEQLSRLPFLDTPHARVDTHRALRQGIPEVVYGAEKTPEQIVEIARALRSAGQDVLVLCHGGVIRMLLSLLLEEPFSRMDRYEVDFASLTVVEHRSNRAEIKLHNFAPWLWLGEASGS